MATCQTGPVTNRRALAAALLATAALAGCGDSKPAATASPSTSPSPTASPAGRAANEVECVNVERAYNAWVGPFLPSTAADVAKMNDADVKRAMEDGDGFANAVKGYQDQPSKKLVVAIAGYNFELSLANVQLTIGGSLDAEQADKVAGAVTTTHSSYQEFVKATCS